MVTLDSVKMPEQLSALEQVLDTSFMMTDSITRMHVYTTLDMTQLLYFSVCCRPQQLPVVWLRFSKQAYSACGAIGADSSWKFARKLGGLGAFKKAVSLSIPTAMAKSLRALTTYVEDAACPHCCCAWRNSAPPVAMSCRTLRILARHPPLPIH